MDFKIRKMTIKDVDVVYQIGVKTRELFAHVGDGWYSRASLKKWAANKNAQALVAEKDGKILGFILATHTPSGGGYLEEMAVRRGWRGKGIGSKLFDTCLKRFKKKGVKSFYGLVQEKNKKMVEFLEKRSFNKGYKFYWMDKEEK